MEAVDYSDGEHSSKLARAVDLLAWPHHCRFTGRAKADLIKLRLSSGDLLDAMRNHLRAKLPLYAELQTMSELIPVMGYIFCPLVLQEQGLQLFCKFIVPDVLSEKDEFLLVTSAHKPNFPCPGEVKK